MNVLIIGGSGGIGRTIVEALLNEGAAVLNIDKGEYKNDSPSYSQMTVDLEGADIESLVRSVLDKQDVDVFINALGTYNVSDIDTFDVGDYKSTMAVNVDVPVRFAVPICRHMFERNSGKIVIIASCGAYSGSRDIPYSMAKSAMVGLVHGLAKNSKGKDVYIYGIAPGIVDTAMAWSMGEERQNDTMNKTLGNRMCRPEEIAKLIRFLVCEEEGFMTGSVIHINGGMYFN